MSAPSDRRAALLERVLLGLTLLAGAEHLRRQDGQISGFDAGDFLFRVGQAMQGTPNPDLHTSFWAYHPPLAFWLTAAVQRTLHVTDVRAVQLVAAGAALIAFLALRDALRRLNLLTTAAGMACLYTAATLPIVVHASASLNMDILILAAEAVALNAAVALWHTPFTANRRLLWALVLAATVPLALLTKFSGLMVVPLAVLCAASAPGTQSERGRRVATAAALCAAGGLLAAPYYQARYFRATGQWFPNVNEWWYRDDLARARERRDADRIGFVVDLVRPRDALPSDNERDTQHLRLEETWRDLWFKDPHLGPSTRAARRIGRLWAWAFGIAALGGVAVLLRGRVDTDWRRLGAILIPFGAVQLAALVSFVWQQPLPEHIPNKALYILPVAWTLAFLAATPLARVRSLRARCTVAGVTGLVALVNLLLPAY